MHTHVTPGRRLTHWSWPSVPIIPPRICLPPPPGQVGVHLFDAPALPPPHPIPQSPSSWDPRQEWNQINHHTCTPSSLFFQWCINTFCSINHKSTMEMPTNDGDNTSHPLGFFLVFLPSHWPLLYLTLYAVRHYFRHFGIVLCFQNIYIPFTQNKASLGLNHCIFAFWFWSRFLHFYFCFLMFLRRDWWIGRSFRHFTWQCVDFLALVRHSSLRVNHPPSSIALRRFIVFLWHCDGKLM